MAASPRRIDAKEEARSVGTSPSCLCRLAVLGATHIGQVKERRRVLRGRRNPAYGPLQRECRVAQYGTHILSKGGSRTAALTVILEAELTAVLRSTVVISGERVKDTTAAMQMENAASQQVCSSGRELGVVLGLHRNCHGQIRQFDKKQIQERAEIAVSLGPP